MIGRMICENCRGKKLPFHFVGGLSAACVFTGGGQCGVGCAQVSASHTLLWNQASKVINIILSWPASVIELGSARRYQVLGLRRK